MPILIVDWWKRRLYPLPEQNDFMLVFARELNTTVQANYRVLDVGAGAGSLNAYQLKGRCKEIVGADLDPRVLENPCLDRGLISDILAMPLPDNSFDVVFAVYVLEHIEQPIRVFSSSDR